MSADVGGVVVFIWLSQCDHATGKGNGNINLQVTSIASNYLAVHVRCPFLGDEVAGVLMRSYGLRDIIDSISGRMFILMIL